MLTFVEKYAFDGFSQNGEQGIIIECLRKIGIEHKLACEFGAANGFYCSNTAGLGLPRVLLDVTGTDRPNGKGVIVIQAEITPENVNNLVPQKLDVLSIDIDGNDYAVWKAYKGTANIVVIEINSSIEPGSAYYKSDPYLGTDYFTMLELGEKKGYFLLAHTGNMIFVKNEFKVYFPEITADPVEDVRLYFRRDWIKEVSQSTKIRKFERLLYPKGNFPEKW